MKRNPILEASDDTFICYCGGVNKKTLLEAIASGHNTVEKLKIAAGICPDDSDCERNNPLGRCCLAEVNALLRVYAAEHIPEAPACSCCCGGKG